MLNERKLKAKMVEAGFDTPNKAAKALGMSPASMYNKLAGKSYFGSDEMEAMIKMFCINKEEACDIFFANAVN